MKHTTAKAIALGCLLGASAAASAFTPAGGLWGFTTELNGQPGRGFQLTVENDVLIFYYYGYDSDGSGNYMFASGPLVGGNVFTGQLLTCSGGTVMGSAYKAATCTNGPGKVTMAFASGEKGTITLPGEAPKPINRFNFGYTDGPDAMLGEFMFAYKASTFNNVDFPKLTIKTGAKIKIYGGEGLGLVSDAAFTFGCDFLVSTTEVKSVYACADTTGSSEDDVYIFRMVGDRGVGVGSWMGNTGANVYPAQVLRVATAKGTRTGPYAENYGMVSSPKSALGNAQLQAVDGLAEAKQRESALGPQAVRVEFDEDELQMAYEWAARARAILGELQNRRK
jgi:hypothetical protein